MFTFFTHRFLLIKQTKQFLPIENVAFTISQTKRPTNRKLFSSLISIINWEKKSSNGIWSGRMNHEWDGKWKTQLIFNLIKFNYFDACFLLLLRLPSVSQPLLSCSNLCLLIGKGEGGKKERERVKSWWLEERNDVFFIPRQQKKRGQKTWERRMKCNYIFAQISM